MKEVVFMWVPEDVAIRGNEAADRAAKEALEKESIDEGSCFYMCS